MSNRFTQLCLWDGELNSQASLQAAADTIFYVGDTVTLLNQELARLIAIAKAIPIRPYQKGKSKETGQENKKRLDLINALRRYHPGALFCSDNWAEVADDFKVSVTRYWVRDGIVWELEYFGLAKTDQAGLLREASRESV